MTTRITLLLLFVLLLASSLVAQTPLKGKGRLATDARCHVESIPTVPRLDDFDTYRDYAAIDDISMGFESVNSQWVQGRVYLAGTTSFVGMVDATTTHYIEAVDGTTPIAGGHAFTADWYLMVTVNQYAGLIVQSPYGSWTQGVAYTDSDVAVVRITQAGGWLLYSLDGVQVFTQYAPDLAQHDWRAYYIGAVDNALIGVKQVVCGGFHLEVPTEPEPKRNLAPCRDTPILRPAPRS